MERVAFLIERTGERIGCLLNPESLTIRRVAGVQRRQADGGPLKAASLADDPLLYTGGGSTELTLDLLFDTSLAGSTVVSEDVRALTRPLWDLTENAMDSDGNPEPRLVRFVWGKSWNIPGVVAAVAERLEFFTESGVPRRSWLRMRLLRAQPPEKPVSAAPALPGIDEAMPALPLGSPPAAPAAEFERTIEMTGGAAPAAEGEPAPAPSRLDEVAFRFFGNAGLWRLIALFNNVADPLHIAAGKLLRIPPRPRAGGGA
ncbi:MAG: hypothetical protein KIT09_23610 [Bryobacteraceae bacterium]|nr:hypothetical protein [Bryobacteraceae bacterium]